MKTKQNKGFICFSVFFYIVFLSLMAIGTVYDLQISKADLHTFWKTSADLCAGECGDLP